MRLFIFFCFFFNIFFKNEGGTAVAQTADMVLKKNLVASRFGKEKVYRNGTRMCIKYRKGNDESKVRGLFAGASNGRIIISADKLGSFQTLIYPEDIIYLRKIRPINRLIAGGIGVVMIGGAMLLFSSIGNSANSIAGALLGIPVAGIGIYSLYYIPVTLIIEKISEKKRVKGWEFSLQ